MIIYTIGHSKRSFDEFVYVLKHFKIKTLVDIRRIPYTNYNPAFNKDSLAYALKKRRINYIYFDDLTGLRSGLEYKISSQCLKDESFRSFAAYMGTKKFEDAIKKLIEIAEESVTTLLCVELLYWECHRALIADALKTMGHKVLHILDVKHVYEHEYTKCARIHDGKLLYI